LKAVSISNKYYKTLKKELTNNMMKQMPVSHLMTAWLSITVVMKLVVEKAFTQYLLGYLQCICKRGWNHKIRL